MIRISLVLVACAAVLGGCRHLLPDEHKVTGPQMQSTSEDTQSRADRRVRIRIRLVPEAEEADDER